MNNKKYNGITIYEKVEWVCLGGDIYFLFLAFLSWVVSGGWF